MKKIIVLMAVLSLVGLMANPEVLRYSNLRKEQYTVIGKNGEEIVVEYYYVTISTEGGSSQEMQISASEYKKIEKIAKKQEREALRASKKWYQNVKDFVTFWNHND